ncbi:synaptotagmin-14 isoform X1 [Anopheles stephensi]|uniref:synaptotagmin-14 isoform X1 n=1 Tax=Anopheles stephensi TaxID=30069 RepID=UPI001658793E|nr:synaptotagmin-14 isoform X1 [Anopheles stephensi]
MVQFMESGGDNQLTDMNGMNIADRLQAHMELTTFFGLALGFVALILVLFLYVNKIRCFGAAPPFIPFDEHLISEKTFHRIRNRFAYDGNNSSDSEDDTLRRLKLEPCGDSYTSSISCYHANENVLDHGPHFTSFNKILSGCKPVHSSRDPLAMAEGGKIGMPHSSNDCSSGSSNEMNLDYGGTRLSLDAHVSNDRLAAGSSCGGGNSPLESCLTGSMDLKHKGEPLLPAELTKECDERDLASRKKPTKLATNNRSDVAGGVGICFDTDLPGANIDRTNLKCKPHGEEPAPTTAVVGFEQASLPQQDSLDDVLSLNNDCILVFSHEPLYDTSDLKSLKSDGETGTTAGFDGGPTTTAGSNGTLEISLLYDAPMRKMTVHVLQARGIASRGDKGQLTHTQVRLLMLPAKRQKHKTKIRSGENPQFMESFLLHRVNPEEVNSMGLRIRVYGCERMRRERLIGETIVSFANIDLELETNLWLPLESRTSNSQDTASTSDLLSIARSDSAGSTTSMQHGGVPELLLGLGYNGITGRLTVEIVKGSHFRNHSLPKVPDTYVKLCLVSSMGQEIARAKTSTRRGQSNPLFKETFIFQVAMFQLNDVTLIVSVYAKRNMKRNEMVGWFSMGLNSSGPEEMIHWNEMRDSSSRSELITRWHVLVDS